MKKFYRVISGWPCKENGNESTQINGFNQLPGERINTETISKMSNFYPNKELPRRFGVSIYPKAKPADFMSQSIIQSTGLMISEKAFNLMRRFTWQQEIEIFEIVAEYKKKEYQYYWLNVYSIHDESIDYNKTEFLLYDILDQSTESIGIEDTYDLHSKRLNFMPQKSILFNNIFLKEENVESLDLIVLPYMGHDFFVSESMKIAIEQENLTAVEFSETGIFIASSKENINTQS